MAQGPWPSSTSKIKLAVGADCGHINNTQRKRWTVAPAVTEFRIGFFKINRFSKQRACWWLAGWFSQIWWILFSNNKACLFLLIELTDWSLKRFQHVSDWNFGQYQKSDFRAKWRLYLSGWGIKRCFLTPIKLHTIAPKRFAKNIYSLVESCTFCNNILR